MYLRTGAYIASIKSNISYFINQLASTHTLDQQMSVTLNVASTFENGVINESIKCLNNVLLDLIALIRHILT